MGELKVEELQSLMKMYRDGVGYVTSTEEFDKLTDGMSEEEKDIFLKKAFLLAVVKNTSSYIEEIEERDAMSVSKRAYNVAISLLMSALDIANIYEIDLSERVLESLMKKFAGDQDK